MGSSGSIFIRCKAVKRQIRIGLELAAKRLNGSVKNETDVAHRQIGNPADFGVAQPVLEFQSQNLLLPWRERLEKREQFEGAFLKLDHFVRRQVGARATV